MHTFDLWQKDFAAGRKARKRSRISRLMICRVGASTVLAVGVLFAAAWNTKWTTKAQQEEEPAPSYTVLYSFTGGADGGFPFAPVVLDREGNVYGTTNAGGASSNNCANPNFGTNSCGVVFKIDSLGNETVLYSFTGGADGALPGYGALLRDGAGNLYGTTTYGGNDSVVGGLCHPAPCGYGVVFKVDPAGNETVLHAFSTSAAEGYSPTFGVIGDREGNLYGNTSVGGTYYQGVVFQLDPQGTETVLYNFMGQPDGGSPLATLVRDTAGNLYGTTLYGGAHNAGSVFKVDTDDNETVLYSFTGGSDGGYPYPSSGTLALDRDGNLYGTTFAGGSNVGSCQYGYPGPGCGVVFKVDPNGNETVLHTFTGPPDGFSPGGIIRDAAGNLYGVAGGGAQNQGQVFKLDHQLRKTVLYSFSERAEGYTTSSLALDGIGNLYGTRVYGGAHNAGVVFKLTVHPE